MPKHPRVTIDLIQVFSQEIFEVLSDAQKKSVIKRLKKKQFTIEEVCFVTGLSKAKVEGTLGEDQPWS